MTDQMPSGEKEWEITTNTYIFAGVGAVILGVSPMQVSAASPTRSLRPSWRVGGWRFRPFLLKMLEVGAADPTVGLPPVRVVEAVLCLL